MAGVIETHRYSFNRMGCVCGGWDQAESAPSHAAHVAEELAKAGCGNVQEAKAEALTDAANWLLNGEAAGIIAYDGPSNRGEVIAAYDAALEDPENWLRERAKAALTVDPADLHREERDGMAEAWREGRAASPDTLNPYEDWPSTPNPLAAALADPEGHALVKAIHDRKVEG
ncbi:hypothetical protein GCM10017708_11580 [Arthrobacter citreus]